MKNILLTIATVSNFMFASPAFSDVGISAFLNEFIYPAGQTVDFYISGYNRGENTEKVDIHIGIIDGKGEIYEYPNWNTKLDPWLSSFAIPANFQLPVTLLGNLNNFPGGLKPGAYQLAVALTTPNTLELLSFNTIAFKVLSLKKTVTSGGISFAHGQSANNITPPIASAAGGFLKVDPADINDLQTPLAELNVGIEQCRFAKDPANLDANLDAGAELILGSPAAGDIILKKSTKSLSYGAIPMPPESFYQPGQRYTVSAEGGKDISAFNVSAIAPKDIIVTEPDLTTLKSVDSRQDFILRWKGNRGVGEINVALQGGGAENSHSILCRFADDGKGVIPAKLLAKLQDVVAKTSSDFPDIPNLPNFPDLPDFDFTELLTEPGINIVLDRRQHQFLNNKDEDSSLFFIFWATSLNTKIK